MQSMGTLFPSSELDKKLNEATSNEPMMPSSSLLYELGRATHRDDDYRIITAAIWQSVLRSNQRPRVLLKTLMLLEAVLLHGPDRALEETIDMKNDIKALRSFSHSDFNEAGKVQEKAGTIIELLEDGGQLQQRRRDAGDAFSGGMGGGYEGFGSDSKGRGPSSPKGGFGGGGFGSDSSGFGSSMSGGVPTSSPRRTRLSPPKASPPWRRAGQEGSRARPLRRLWRLVERRATRRRCACLLGSGKISVNLPGREVAHRAARQRAAAA